MPKSRLSCLFVWEKSVPVLEFVSPQITPRAAKEAAALLRNSEGQGRLLLDLVNLRSLDARSAGALLSWIRQARGQGVELALCGLAPEVRAVAQLLGLHTLVMIYNSRSEAVAALGPLLPARRGGVSSEHAQPALELVQPAVNAAAARTGTGRR